MRVSVYFPGCGSGRPLGLALLIAAAPFLPAYADWEPPPPMPDDFDWVQLTSGEWLKGEVKVMYQDSLEFDSEELDLQTFDLEDIKMIRSAQIINLRVRSGEIAAGKLLLDGDVVTVVADDSETFSRADILSVTAGVQRERNYWVGDVSVGGNLRSGNTEQTELNTNLSFERRTVVSRLSIDHLGNYSETNGAATANNQRGNITWDRFRSAKVFSRPVFAEYFSDPFQNVARRNTIGTGIGFQLRDTAKTDWSVAIGPAYQSTTFDQVQAGEPESEGTWALSAGTNYDTDLTRRIEFEADYNFQLTSEDAGRFNHHMVTTFSLELTNALDFDVSLVWDRIKEPKPNTDGSIPLRDDYRLIFAVGYEF